MTSTRTPSEREALNRALREEVEQTCAGDPGQPVGDLATRVRAYGLQLQHAESVLQLRLAFSLARRRASADAPASVAMVRDALDDLQRRVGASPTGPATDPATRASEPLPEAPPFALAAQWLDAHPEARAQVERELAELTRSWPSSLQPDRERFRRIATVLVYRRLHRVPSRSA